MGLTVENGQGLSNADSYASVADADAYHESHSGDPKWSQAEASDKEKALRLATQFLDIRYGSSWRGARSSTAQALDWPRIGVIDRDGFSLGSTVIPSAVKSATAEAALRYIGGENLLADIGTPGTIKSYSVSVGPIKESTQYAEPSGPTAEHPIIDGLLRRVLRQHGEVRRA